MTSGNRSQEPICIDNQEARSRLADLADVFLMSDRPIHVPVDDSVVRVLTDEPGGILPIRRSRGYAPYPVPISFDGPSVLAVGGELKATACLTAGSHAFMSQHIGDMENLETFEMFERVTEHLLEIFKTQPEVMACDMHPGYLSARWAREHRVDLPLVEVQHHHAHVASLLAEHGHNGPVIGFSFDGTGYGTDGTIWGGEVLLADLREFERVGHLAPSVLAGGDAAVRHPRRQALTRLAEAGVAWDGDLPPVKESPEDERRILARQLQRRINTVETTSMGRLFDAVSSLCGVCHVAEYEGQAAIELESMAGDAEGFYPLPTVGGVWDTDVLVRAVVADVRRGADPGSVSARFHRSVANAMRRAALDLSARHGLRTVGLSGGVFQNVTLTRMAVSALTQEGFEVLTHRRVPPNDGGLALGQAAVAASRSA
jgi:hydrogenase maturation protein HypF